MSAVTTQLGDLERRLSSMAQLGSTPAGAVAGTAGAAFGADATLRQRRGAQRVNDGLGSDRDLRRIRQALEDSGGLGELEDFRDELDDGINNVDLEAGLADLFPPDAATGFTSREQARVATQKALEGLPTSLRNTISYPLNEHVGYPARDSLKSAGDLCEYLEKLDLRPNNMGWVRPYLMAMGGALQLLDMVTFKSPETLRTIPVAARQRILMSMDLLSGCLTYATSTIEGTYNESLRRNFLLTHGLRFVSSERARKLYRYGVGEDKMRGVVTPAASASLINPLSAAGAPLGAAPPAIPS